ncbi:hypothetical protein LFML04_0716 [Leptospirillum ferriphilum ML-04]|uniref:Uncharacterized protein n=1 Tax=Leptospirillum ferriphilum (strain ML-04) TaxID=1048260 RepID=J9Z9V5_LEPFM|nr:hypothetical protein LFML04_0716 [Leptospirillum ferriphilum ML-04]
MSFLELRLPHSSWLVSWASQSLVGRNVAGFKTVTLSFTGSIHDATAFFRLDKCSALPETEDFGFSEYGRLRMTENLNQILGSMVRVEPFQALYLGVGPALPHLFHLLPFSIS